MVIDFHTHIFPEKIAEAAVRSLEESSGLSRAVDGDAGALLSSMKTDGVDYSLILPVATNTKQVPKINDFAVEIQNEYHNLPAFAGMHPDFDNIREELIRVKKLGLQGVKIHPDYVGCFADDDRMVNCVKICAELDLPVILHGGADQSFPELVRCTPERVYNLLKKVPDATLIIAHMGGYLYFDDFKFWLMDSNVYIDTSVGVGWGYEEKYEDIFREFPSDKILFGTDSPWEKPADCLKVLYSLNLDSETLEKITYKNALKLLNL